MLKGVAEQFTKQVKNDAKINAILKKVKAGKATQRDIATYADLLGEKASHVLSRAIQFGADDEEAYETIKAILDSNYLSINGQAVLELRAEDKRKGLDIIIRQAENKRTDDFINTLKSIQTEAEYMNELTEESKTISRQFYDDFQKTNAELRQELGYDEIVIRVYDDVGLRDRTKPCQFCLSRQGEWDYSSAAQQGIFQRHEGCGCHITISTPSWTRTQTKWNKTADSKGNQWT